MPQPGSTTSSNFVSLFLVLTEGGALPEVIENLNVVSEVVIDNTTAKTKERSLSRPEYFVSNDL